MTQISEALAFKREDGRVVYFNYQMPVFMHDEGDDATFRMITSQFCVNGSAKQAEIIRAFGVTPISVKRSVKKFRSSGPKAFYQKQPGRGPSKLTADVITEAQAMLNVEESTAAIAEALGLGPNTIIKAIGQGKLMRLKKIPPTTASSKSERSIDDTNAPMGVGASNVVERILASVGAFADKQPEFKPALDLAIGGVLLAVPALLALGLLRHTRSFFQLPKGYYGIESIFLLLAFMLF